MMKRSVTECSLVAVTLIVGCSTSEPVGLGSGSTQSPNSASTNRTSISASAGGSGWKSSSPGGSHDSTAPSGGSASPELNTSPGGANQLSNNGGATQTDDSTGVAGWMGETWDPPLPVGETNDPTVPDGSTNDPPVGDTGDPPVGTTDDPPTGDTNDPPPGDTNDPPPGDTTDPPDDCILTEIDKVNVIVFGNATPSGADVEGKMWVGGNATFQGYGIAANDLGATGKACSEYTLVVGGDLSGQVHAGNGMVAVYGSNLTSNLTAPCGVTKEHPVDFATVETRLKGYSTAYRSYASNGTAASVYGGLTLTGASKDLNVFSITASQLKSSSITISVPAGSSVLVNVSGKDVYFGGLGFFLPSGSSCRGGTSDWCHRILWNFFEATTLQLQGIGVQGTVMAPYARVEGSGGNVDGQLIAEELTGGIEYHPYFFSGCLLLSAKP